MTLTAKQLRRELSYDPKTGLFRWIAPKSGVTVGSVAGTLDMGGYVGIKIMGKTYKAHRLVWLHTYGKWPRYQLDHVNRDRSDNRIGNLREATHSQNCGNSELRKNNKTGVRGVVLCPWGFQAHIWSDNKQNYLGTFASVAEAKKAYDTAARKHFGEFYSGE